MDLNHGGAVVREEYQEIRSVFSTGRDNSGVSAVLFDPLEELVWTGNQSVGTTYVNLHVCLLPGVNASLFLHKKRLDKLLIF